MERAFVVTVHVPEKDLMRVSEALIQAAPLTYGKYDQVLFYSATGRERFRGLKGSRVGAARQATEAKTVQLTYSIPRDRALLRRTLDAVSRAHRYEEPVITVVEGWRTRALAKAARKNPNKWWNRPRRP